MTPPTAAEVADDLERLALDMSAKHQEWLDMGDEAYGQQYDAAQARLCLFVSEHRALILSALRALSAEPSDEEVERAAEALAGPWIGDDGPWGFDMDQARNLARAALRSRRAEGGQ